MNKHSFYRAGQRVGRSDTFSKGVIPEKLQLLIVIMTFKMKNLVFFFALIFTSSLYGQNLTGITKAIGEGNAELLGQNFDTTVEVAILDSEEVYPKTDAVKALRDFFSKHKVSSFSQMHQGASRGQDSQFVIGNLNTSSGTFRVYLYMKVSGGKYLVQEVRFDKG
jgi:hypothetical protein